MHNFSCSQNYLHDFALTITPYLCDVSHCRHSPTLPIHLREISSAPASGLLTNYREGGGGGGATKRYGGGGMFYPLRKGESGKSFGVVFMQ